jgi:hypothetical protein
VHTWPALFTFMTTPLAQQCRGTAGKLYFERVRKYFIVAYNTLPLNPAELADPINSPTTHSSKPGIVHYRIETAGHCIDFSVVYPCRLCALAPFWTVTTIAESSSNSAENARIRMRKFQLCH